MTLGGLLQQTAGQLHQLIAQQPASRKNSRKTQPSWPPDEWFSRPVRAELKQEELSQEEEEEEQQQEQQLKQEQQQQQQQQQQQENIILSDSPSNTQSIPPIPSQQQQPTTPPPPPPPPPPARPQQASSHPPTSFRPPPLHPSRTNQPLVKETLDAHSSFSELGQKQVNQYLIKQEIGRGSFGAVQLAEDAQTGLSYAIKELSKTRLKRKFARELMLINQPFIDHHHHDALFLIRNEVAIMKKIRHHNLVRLHEVLDVEGEDSLYMVMEYCPGGSLMRLVQETRLARQPSQKDQAPGILSAGLDLDLARKYFRQLVAGIDYLHRNEIIHYDIKPDNLLLSSDKKQLKVVDFGISAMFVKPGDDSTVSRTIGSPAFLSPELINAANADGPVSGTAADIWAMGVTLYFMLTGSLPFPSEQIMAMYDAVENQAPAIPDEWDGPLLDLMSRILDKQPSTRIKMASLRGHGWLTNGGKLPPVDGGEPSPRAGSVPDKCRGPPGEAAPRISETELSDSFRFGFTNRCPVFSELVDNALRLSSWKPASAASSSSANTPPHLLGRRKELFFKEFHRQISERTKTKFQLQS